MSWITGALGVIGSGVKGFFGVKGKQAENVSKAIETATSLSHNDNEARKAASKVIVAEAQSGYWLAAVWRPLLMLVFAGLVIARWFGYLPPDMSEEEVFKLYDLMELGIGGYIGGRTLEKIVSSINIGKVLKKLSD